MVADRFLKSQFAISKTQFFGRMTFSDALAEFSVKKLNCGVGGLKRTVVRTLVSFRELASKSRRAAPSGPRR